MFTSRRSSAFLLAKRSGGWCEPCKRRCEGRLAVFGKKGFWLVDPDGSPVIGIGFSAAKGALLRIWVVPRFIRPKAVLLLWGFIFCFLKTDRCKDSIKIKGL